MKKKYGLLLLVVGLILITIILNLMGWLAYLNFPINRIIKGVPDKSCEVNSDCVLRGTGCYAFGCSEVVNKNWKVYCPFKIHAGRIFTKPCASEGIDFDILCINKLCQQVGKH